MYVKPFSLVPQRKSLETKTSLSLLSLITEIRSYTDPDKSEYQANCRSVSLAPASHSWCVLSGSDWPPGGWGWRAPCPSADAAPEWQWGPRWQWWWGGTGQSEHGSLSPALCRRGSARPVTQTQNKTVITWTAVEVRKGGQWSCCDGSKCGFNGCRRQCGKDV